MQDPVPVGPFTNYDSACEAFKNYRDPKNAELRLLCDYFAPAAILQRRLESTNRFPAQPSQATVSFSLGTGEEESCTSGNSENEQTGRRKFWCSRTTHKMAADTLLWTLTKPPIQQKNWYCHLLGKTSVLLHPNTSCLDFLGTDKQRIREKVLLIWLIKASGKCRYVCIFKVTRWKPNKGIKMTEHSQGQLGCVPSHGTK